MKVLIDGDIVAYRCACTCEEDETSDIVLFRVNELMGRIINSVTADSYTVYLSGGINFRKEIDPEYKANRKDKPKPKWLETCREFLVTQWQAIVTDGIEADDALGIAQREDTIIASIDKDLLQVPGNHYNFVKNETYFISEEEGLKRFWMQMLTGDVADNIFGVKGIGPVKAAKHLDSIEWEDLEELDRIYYERVSALYNDPIRLHKNAKLLWVLRREEGIWLSPDERKEKDGMDRGQKEELHNLSIESGKQEMASQV